MFVSETQLRVRYADTDKMGVVYHSNYINYFEVARTESIRNLGITYAAMETAGIIMPVIEVHCRYIRPATYDDLITVTANLHELPEGHRITFHQEAYNDKKEVLARGHVVLYFMEARTMKRAAMPAPLRDALLPFFGDATK
ncbi:acyl-CoA thioesterase [Niabella drilacis]|uniref:Acyl-CoA thioester hydrolase n=1 Tax=Niabella drilacis (strain DSM 25811 / CCM 8410 / CCUG 62505 / LMG 26954 / E90) TaxID=1285928 RepID=A0A1G6Z1F2_NIADE|nr:thioesterase family protein [Niabella drilacis]SDD96143.1 acyl-CoA thioester hydrolase [Niabella drilacis]